MWQFKCSMCDKNYGNKQNLANYTSKAHGDEQDITEDIIIDDPTVRGRPCDMVIDVHMVKSSLWSLVV